MGEVFDEFQATDPEYMYSFLDWMKSKNGDIEGAMVTIVDFETLPVEKASDIEIAHIKKRLEQE